MMNRRSRGSENGRSELDILKGRWAVRRDGMAMDKGDTRRGDARPVFEGLGSILKGEYERRRSMATAGERERERECIWCDCDQSLLCKKLFEGLDMACATAKLLTLWVVPGGTTRRQVVQPPSSNPYKY
ncbi:hypothetical protein EDB89DRAFT_1902630 [Lactarius sanguifluus]|nr:hypothetical protein EDB89DRAFT_1902630 [Lactarius sanguifluus]